MEKTIPDRSRAHASQMQIRQSVSDDFLDSRESGNDVYVVTRLIQVSCAPCPTLHAPVIYWAAL